MALFHRSLAEDNTDRLNHTWSVALFLILAFVTWLLPLAPVYIYPTPNAPHLGFKSQNDGPEIPEYEADCWSPAHFTGSMVSYAKKYCANVFNQILDSNETSTTRLYDFVDSNFTDPFSEDLPPFKPRITRRQLSMETQKQRRDGNKKTTKTTDKEPKADAEVAMDPDLYIKAPVILFIFAICLKIPQMLWSLVSSGLDQTLTAATQAQTLDRETRRAVLQDLSSALNTSGRGSFRFLGSVYMLFKLIAFLVLVAELLYLGISVLPHIDQESRHLQARSSSSTNDLPLLKENPSPTFQSPEQLTGYDGRPLVCSFEIRQFQNVRSYGIQCIFSPKWNPWQDAVKQKKLEFDSDGRSPIARGPSAEVRRQFLLLSLQKAAMTAVLAYLVILSINALFNTLSWLCRLILGQCGSVGRNLPMDARLVVAMSKENAGILVTNQLTESCQWGGKSDHGKLQEEAM